MAAIEVKEPLPLKRCRLCGEEKALDQFYKAGTRYRNDCKVCHNRTTTQCHRARRVYVEPRGFAALAPEKQQQIIADFAAGKPLMQLAIDHGVHLDRIRYWKSTGKLGPPPGWVAN